jgi:hypothetical protein
LLPLAADDVSKDAFLFFAYLRKATPSHCFSRMSLAEFDALTPDERLDLWMRDVAAFARQHRAKAH